MAVRMLSALIITLTILVTPVKGQESSCTQSIQSRLYLTELGGNSTILERVETFGNYNECIELCCNNPECNTASFVRYEGRLVCLALKCSPQDSCNWGNTNDTEAVAALVIHPSTPPSVTEPSVSSGASNDNTHITDAVTTFTSDVYEDTSDAAGITNDVTSVDLADTVVLNVVVTSQPGYGSSVSSEEPHTTENHEVNETGFPHTSAANTVYAQTSTPNAPVEQTTTVSLLQQPVPNDQFIPSSAFQPVPNVSSVPSSAFQPPAVQQSVPNFPSEPSSAFQPPAVQQSVPNVPSAPFSAFQPPAVQQSVPNFPSEPSSAFQPPAVQQSVPNVPSAPFSAFQPPAVQQSVPNVPSAPSSAFQPPAVQQSVPNFPSEPSSAFQTPAVQQSVPNVPSAPFSAFQPPAVQQSVPNVPSAPFSAFQTPAVQQSVPNDPSVPSSAFQPATLQQSLSPPVGEFPEVQSASSDPDSTKPSAQPQSAWGTLPLASPAIQPDAEEAKDVVEEDDVDDGWDDDDEYPDSDDDWDDWIKQEMAHIDDQEEKSDYKDDDDGETDNELWDKWLDDDDEYEDGDYSDEDDETNITKDPSYKAGDERGQGKAPATRPQMNDASFMGRPAITGDKLKAFAYDSEFGVVNRPLIIGGLCSLVLVVLVVLLYVIHKLYRTTDLARYRPLREDAFSAHAYHDNPPSP